MHARHLSRDQRAVSPLIGTILVVAITVAMAALVAAGIGGWGHDVRPAHQNVGVQLSSPHFGQVVATLVVAEPGQGPYNLTDVIATIDYLPCSIGTTGTMGIFTDADGDGLWGVGESISFNGDCQYPTPAALASGSTHTMSISIKGTPVALDSQVRIH